MADEEKKVSPPDMAKLVGDGAVAAAVAYGTTHSSAHALGAAMLKVGPAAWGSIVDFARDRIQRAKAAWGNAVEAELPPEGKERDRVVAASPEVILDHIRRLMEGVDPAVVPALGRLAGMYVAEERKPDDFFRGATRMLCDFTAEELDDARRIFSVVWGIPPEREYVFLVAAGDPVRVHWRKAKSKADGMWEVAVEESVQNAPRILRALRLAGLADDGPPGKMDLLLGPGMVSMRREAVFVLAKVLRT